MQHTLWCSFWLTVGLINIPYLPVYKSTFYSLRNCPKNRPRLIHGSKTEIKKSSEQIFYVIIAYLKENSKIKDKFFKNYCCTERKLLKRFV